MSVIVPFHGDREDAQDVCAALRVLRRAAADEVFLVDNTADSVVPERDDEIAVLRAPAQQSSYYARNVGAERAAADWLLFIDADCRPPADLLDTYFDPSPADGCGLVAGGVRGAAGQKGFVARWARSRGHVGETYHVERGPRPAGITANLLVRKDAWAEVGGFHEGVRSGGDIEFCWRVQEIGWGFEHRPESVLEHLHVEALVPLLRKAARYGAGRTWVERRYPGSSRRPRLARESLKALVGSLGFTLRGQPLRGSFKLVDGAWYAALAWGHIAGDNRADRARVIATSRSRLIGEAFPVPVGEPAAADTLEVEAVRRPLRVDRAQLGARANYLEDDPPAERLGSAVWCAARHPVRSLRAMRAGTERKPPLKLIAPAVRRLGRDGVVALEPLLREERTAFAKGVSSLAGLPLFERGKPRA